MVVNHFILQLSDAQARLSTLESELAHLKPILLMKPYALMHSDAPKHRKKKSAVAVGSDTNADGTDDAPAEDEVQQSPERRPRGQYYRQREQPLLANSPRKPGTSSRKATRVSMVDARTEHLLLAAKKIGRERASVLAAQNYQEQNDPKAGPSNIPMNQPSYKGKGRADGGTMFTFTEYVPKVPTTPTPKTPQKQTARTPAAAVTMSPSVPSAYANASPGFTSMVQPYTYIPPPVPASGYALFGAGPYTFPPPPPPTYPNTLNASPSRAPVASANNGQGSSSSLVSTPGGAHRPSDSNQPSTSGSNGPSTPFDKLITAARSVLSPAGVPESPTRNTNQDSSRPLGLAYSLPDNDGSPTPKRRKPSSARFAREANMNRTASALDVLADQAAVASSSPERHPNDDTVEADGGGMQEMSVAPVVDVGGVRGVFSAVDPFVPHPRAGQRRPRGRGARGALEPAARLTRSPRRGRGQGRAQTQAQRQTVQTQAVRSRTQSPADVDMRNGGHAVNEDARSDVSQQRSASVSSGAADPPGAAEDDVRSNRASTPGQDDVRQRWLAKLGMCHLLFGFPLRVLTLTH